MDFPGQSLDRVNPKTIDFAESNFTDLTQGVIDIRNIKILVGFKKTIPSFTFPYVISRHTKTNKKQEILQQRMYITIPRFF